VKESNDFVVQLDEEVERMHREIFSLKQHLKSLEAKEHSSQALTQPQQDMEENVQ